MTTPVIYECHACRTRLGDALPWCPTCQDDTLAVRVDTSDQPLPVTWDQRIAIYELFTVLGEMHKATRMRDLSGYIGRQVWDYDQLTAAEADTATKALRKRNHGTRT